MVEVFNEDYRLKEQGAILNWFEITAREGCFSVNDKISDILATLRGKLVFPRFMGKCLKGRRAKRTGRIASAQLIC